MTSSAWALNAPALAATRDVRASASALKLRAPATSSEEAAPNDEILFARASQGDRAALGELIGRYESFLYGLLVRMAGGDEHRAEDFFQDTFLNAMRSSATFDRKKAFKPWIAAIAVNPGPRRRPQAESPLGDFARRRFG